MVTLHAASTQALSTFGALIRRERLARRWSQADLGERLGVSRQTLVKVEAGDRGVAIGTYFEAAVLVGVPLLGDDAERQAINARTISAEVALLPSRVREGAVFDDF